MMKFEELLIYATEHKASDLHITVGSPPVLRKNGKMIRLAEWIVTPENSENYVRSILDDEQLKCLLENGEVDLSFSMHGVGRFRINVFKQRGTFSIATRIMNFKMPTIEDLGLPPIVKEITKLTNGLVLVTGPTGSGKSTSLAAMVDRINSDRCCHILTIEDPVEYLHKHKKSIVNQRDIGTDTKSYSEAVRAALREDPDVILLGEMRDEDTIGASLTAAETGQLVLSTLHTIGAAQTIDRIIDIFPPNHQRQIRVQLAGVLRAVISQQLLERNDKVGRVVASEVMLVNSAIKNLIREGKTYQIDSIIQTSKSLGMQTMDSSIANLYNSKIIDHDEAVTHSFSTENFKRLVGIL